MKKVEKVPYYRCEKCDKEGTSVMCKTRPCDVVVVGETTITTETKMFVEPQRTATEQFILDWTRKHGQWKQIPFESESYKEISDKIYDMDALVTNNSMHVYEQQFLVDNVIFRVSSTIGSDADPIIEEKIG